MPNFHLGPSGSRPEPTRRRIRFATAAILFLAPALGAATQEDDVLALGQLTAPPTICAAEGFADEDGLKAIFYDGLPWKGKPTRVFAWLGIPKGLERDGKVPGIVLVHGGGGTASKVWVKKWNERGFAAISMAVEGQTDERDPPAANGRRAWQSHEWSGPKRLGIYADSDEPLKDQWMYHAVADTVLANSLLRSLPEVDAARVGVMGISWGGVITSTVIGIDDRFAFAIPTYGCGHLFDSENFWGDALRDNELYREVWDPMVRTDRVNTPTLWFSWPKDVHFSLASQAACYRAAPGPRMVALLPDMGHSEPAGWKPPDSYAFAESVVAEGKPWCRQTGLRVEEGEVAVEFSSTKDLDRPVLISTANTGFTGDREWTETPANLERREADWIVTATLPEGTTAWFVNARSGELTASSEYYEVE